MLRLGAPRPITLCYHAVTAEWPHALATKLEVLERQVRSLLRRGYAPARGEDVVCRGGRLLHVTFDDAFRSIGDAIPVLRALSVPVTIFACAEYADDGRPLDVPELAGDVAEYPHQLETLTWDGLRALGTDGLEVGSHTLTHPHLTTLSDHALRYELARSRLRVEEELRRPCRFLAYPYGEQDERVRCAAREAGYEAAFALPGSRASANPFAVPRVGLYRDNGPLKVRLKTSGLVR